MKNERKIYTLAQRLSSLLMILTLLWLTVSISFVYTSMDDASLEQASTTSLPADNEEESANPFGNKIREALHFPKNSCIIQNQAVILFYPLMRLAQVKMPVSMWHSMANSLFPLQILADFS